MAFQAGGPHAQDRGLEAVAYAYDEQAPRPGDRRCGRSRRASGDRSAWRSASASCRAASSSSSGAAPSRPGTGTRGCSRAWPPATPCSSNRIRGRSCRWRSPCGIVREVLAEPVSTRTSCASPPTQARITGVGDWPRSSRVRPEVRDRRLHRLDRLRGLARGSNARQAQVYTEKAGVNQVSRLDARPRRDARATSRSRCPSTSGQMCTTPQNI